jgi:lipoprotein NlpI
MRLILLASIAWDGSAQDGSGQASDAEAWLRRAEAAADKQQSQQAVELATEAIKRDAMLADAYYLRGREKFRVGDFAGSVSDFDEFVKLRPTARSRLWERGISCYYAQRFQEGADQFAAYQDFDDSDVENAVWHVMCLSRIHGLAAAQRQIMPVKADTRVPMAQVYRLFRGDGMPQDVIQAAADTTLTDEQRRTARFYAHLYVGLFHEVSGNEALARQHLTEAADKFRVPHYMWHVAQVHASRWKSAPAEDAQSP